MAVSLWYEMQSVSQDIFGVCSKHFASLDLHWSFEAVNIDVFEFYFGNQSQECLLKKCGVRENPVSWKNFVSSEFVQIYI